MFPLKLIAVLTLLLLRIAAIRVENRIEMNILHRVFHPGYFGSIYIKNHGFNHSMKDVRFMFEAPWSIFQPSTIWRRITGKGSELKECIQIKSPWKDRVGCIYPVRN